MKTRETQKVLLTQEQKEAIAAPLDEPIVVLAGPGSGKTTLLISRIKWMIEKQYAPFSKIGVVTFTTTMADELSKRAINEIGGSAAISTQNIGTIHAFCYRLLDRPLLAKEWRVRSIIEESAERLQLQDAGINTLRWWIDYAKQEGISRVFLPSWYEKHLVGKCNSPSFIAKKLLALYDDLKHGLGNEITFSDMLYNVWDRLNRDEEFIKFARSKYKYIVIDEAQDTTRLAMDILRLIADNRIFIVGDADQTLFRFTGASPEHNLFDLSIHSRVFMLTTNFRSAPNIVDASNRLIKQNYTSDREQFSKVLKSKSKQITGSVTIQYYQTANDEARKVALSIKESKTPFYEVFIGYRVNAQSALIEQQLVELGIPYRTQNGEGFYGQRHIRDIIEYTRLIDDRDDDEAFERVYNIASNWMTDNEGEYVPHRYLGAKFLSSISSNRSLWRGMKSSNDSRYKRGKDDLIRLVESIDAEKLKPVDAIKAIFDRCYRKHYARTNGIRSSDPIDLDVENDWNTLISVSEKFDSLEDFLFEIDRISSESKTVKKNQVVLSTIHRLKGQERKVVYGIGWSEGLLPHHKALSEDEYVGGTPLIVPSVGTVEDERCAAFVLVTRAKEEVFLSSIAEWQGRQLEPSRFLKEIQGE